MTRRRRPQRVVADETRGTITITLGGKLEGIVPVNVDIPVMSPPPDVLLFRQRIYVRKSDNSYTVARTWPILEDLDKATMIKRKTAKVPEPV